jgi:copper transport protein
VFGGLLAIRLSWPDGVEYKLTHTYLKLVWGVAVVGTYLLLAATAASNSGGSIVSALSPAGWTGLIDTAPGKAALLRFLAIAAAGWVVLRPERILDPATQLLATMIPLIAVATMGVARDQYTMLDNLLGVLHAVSMAAWLGGAALMARVVLAGSGERDLVHAVRHYSKYAISAMGVTVVTGAAMALSIDGSSFTTSHGMLLVLKTLVGLVMAAMAVMARQGVMARTRPNGAMSTNLSYTLRRVFSLQSLVGLVTLALTTWLLALTPPGVTEASSVSMKLGSAHHFQNLATGVDITLRFSERVGTNDVRIEVMKPATGLTDLEIDFTPPAGSTVNGMAITPIPLTGVGAAILTQDKGFTLSTSGTWTVTARAGGQEVDSTEIYIASGSSNG